MYFGQMNREPWYKKKLGEGSNCLKRTTPARRTENQPAAPHKHVIHTLSGVINTAHQQGKISSQMLILCNTVKVLKIVCAWEIREHSHMNKILPNKSKFVNS